MDKIISKLLEIKWLASIKVNTAPRWMVLFVDLIIISCSYLLLATSEAFIPGHSISSLVFLRNWGSACSVFADDFYHQKLHFRYSSVGF